MSMNENQIKKIILIISDTHRAKNVGLYGASPSPTPVVDTLGRKGVVFSNTYTSITKTDSSVTAMMMGKYPMSSGFISHGKWTIQKQAQNLSKFSMLAEILQKNNYFTAAVDFFGRWHKRGFSYYSGKVIKDINEKKIAGKNLPFLESLRFLDGLFVRFLKRDFFVRFYYCFFPKPIVPYDPANAVVDHAIEILDKHKNKDLFLYVHFRDAHSPYVRPKGLRSFLFDSVEDRYNAEIHFMDQQIGKLIKYVEKTGDLNETLIIFTADHGESLIEHDIYIAHHDPYEVVIKVPLIFYNPTFKPRKIDSFVQNIDIFPTILEILGVNVPQDIDGKSLLSLIKGKSKKMREYIFFDDNLFGEYIIKKSRRKLGVRFGNFKYIRTLEGKDEDLFSPIPFNTKIVKEELFDLANDPEEQRNLNPTRKDILKKLRKILEAQISFLAKKRN